MDEEKRWARSHAQAVSDLIVARLVPMCERIQVAGSLRRGKPFVGDVEILYIPKMVPDLTDLLGQSESINAADSEIEAMLREGLLTKRLNQLGSQTWGAKNKYCTHLSGLPIDLFATDSESWWNYLVCRTGPAASNTRIATAAMERGYRWSPYKPGFIRRSDGELIPMDSEEAVFRFVGLPYFPTEERT